MMERKRGLQRGFVLHARPYSNTSLLLELLSAEEGRYPAIARGVKGRRSAQSGLLRPFQPLLLELAGRGEVATLVRAEPGGRPLSLSGEAGYCGLYVNELLMRLLETRAPLSQTLGVGPEKTVFCFNEGKGPLYYCGDLDTMVCLEMAGTTLRVYDVVAPVLPSSENLLSRMPWRFDRVEANFATDQFLRGAKPLERVFDHDGPSYLMARGPFVPEGTPFTLPRPART